MKAELSEACSSYCSHYSWILFSLVSFLWCLYSLLSLQRRFIDQNDTFCRKPPIQPRLWLLTKDTNLLIKSDFLCMNEHRRIPVTTAVKSLNISHLHGQRKTVPKDYRTYPRFWIMPIPTQVPAGISMI